MFLKNLHYLMKIKGNMSHATLARAINTDEQVIESWFNNDLPSVDDVIKLSDLFLVGVDELLKVDMTPDKNIYSSITIGPKKGFRYLPYSVISRSPEDDAMLTVKNLAKLHGVQPLAYIGWDFPFITPEQQSHFRMRGYTAAYVIDDKHPHKIDGEKTQELMEYASITVRDPMKDPEKLIPYAYQILQQYIDINGIEHEFYMDEIQCYEYLYEKDGIEYMDINIALHKKTA